MMMSLMAESRQERKEDVTRAFVRVPWGMECSLFGLGLWKSEGEVGELDTKACLQGPFLPSGCAPSRALDGKVGQTGRRTFQKEVEKDDSEATEGA